MRQALGVEIENVYSIQCPNSSYPAGLPMIRSETRPEVEWTCSRGSAHKGPLSLFHCMQPASNHCCSTHQAQTLEMWELHRGPHQNPSPPPRRSEPSTQRFH